MKYIANAFVTKVTNAVVREFQKQSTYLFSDDAGLKNCWDEICVITQEGDNAYTEIIESTIDELIALKINALKADSAVLCAVWMQTHNGADWLESQTNTDSLEPTYNIEDVIAHISEEVLNKAMNWSNKRIEYYADNQYELDDGYY